jgi:hypothetical protein
MRDANLIEPVLVAQPLSELKMSRLADSESVGLDE